VQCLRAGARDPEAIRGGSVTTGGAAGSGCATTGAGSATFTGAGGGAWLHAASATTNNEMRFIATPSSGVNDHAYATRAEGTERIRDVRRLTARLAREILVEVPGVFRDVVVEQEARVS